MTLCEKKTQGIIHFSTETASHARINFTTENRKAELKYLISYLIFRSL